MATLAELKAAALRGQQAQQSMAGLDEQRAEALALRDQPQPQVNQYGTVSPFAVVADMINKSRGRKQLRGIEPKREEMRKALADSTSTLQTNQLRMALEKEQREKEELRIKGSEFTLKQTMEQNKQAERKRQAELDKLKLSDDANTWTNGKDKVAVRYDPDQDKFVFAATGVPISEDFYPMETTFGGGYGGKRISPNTVLKITENANQVRKVSATAGRWEPRFVQLGGTETEILNKAIAKGSSNDLLKLVASDNLTQDARDAAQWWADWAMFYELPERHRLFGATLTNNEMASWKEAVAVLRGMNTDEAQKRIQKLVTELRKDLAVDVSSIRMLRRDHPSETGALDMIMGETGYELGENGIYKWKEATSEDSTAADSAAPPYEPRELTDAERMEYGRIVQSLTPDQQAKFKQLSPMGQRKLLDQIYDRQMNQMTE